MIFLNTLYCIISHLVIIRLTMPAACRWKRLLSGQVWARRWDTQQTATQVKCSVLTRRTPFGMPETARVV